MRNIEAVIEVAVSPEKVIRGFTDADMLKSWWGVERSLIELKIGGLYTIAWGISDKGMLYISSGVIKEYDPAGLLHIEKYIYLNPGRSFLGPQELKIHAVPSGNGCTVVLTQGPYPENSSADWDWYYEAVVEAWPTVLTTLKKFIEEKFSS